MKISKKLLISNIVINIIAMITLSIIIGGLVSNYIKKDTAEELIKENDTMIKLIDYRKFLHYNGNKLVFDKSFYAKVSRNATLSTIYVIDESNSLLNIIPLSKRKIYTDDKIEKILNEDLKQVYDINIDDNLLLAYNNKIKITLDDKEFIFLVNTMIPKLIIKELITSIIIVLIASILVISLLSLIITSYMGRRITKPIEKLKEVTEKIANKDFSVKAIINTGDELESLATSVNNMAERIKRSEIEQKKFYENVSHELKTPVTVISGYAQGMKTNIFDDNEKVLDTIIEESTQLKKQLDNIIYLSKLDTINDIFHFDKSNINDVISNSIKKVDSIMILNDIDVIYEPIEDITLNIDSDKMMRMLINVLSNCIKYTKDTIYISTQLKSNTYEIVISDNGKGFSKKILENPFSRAMVGEKEGTGIGLSIVKKIIDCHNGYITLGNKCNGGAIYTIELPLYNRGV